MSNAAEKIQFVPRANLKRTLTYRKNLGRFFHFQVGYGAFLFLIGVGSIIYNAGCDCSIKTKMTLGDSTAMFLGLSALLFYAARRTGELSKTKVHVNPEGLALEKPNKTIEIAFKDISAIELAYIPRLTGWFEIVLNDKSKHKFPVGLERSEYILESIANYNPQLVTLEQIEAYRRTSIIGDHTSARHEETLHGWLSKAARFVGLPIAAAIATTAIRYLSGKPFEYGLSNELVFRSAMFAGICFVIGSIAYVVVENRIVANGRAKLLQNPNNASRDMAYENRIQKIARLSHYAVFLSCVAALYFYAWISK